MALIDLLKFATSGPWGPSTNDRRLTAPEADGNINNLALAIQDLIDNPVEGVSVSEISVTGRQVTFHMSDASTHGPFDLPIAQPRYRGEWVTATAYSTFDIIKVTLSGTYMVLQDHTSESTFDEDASNSDGAYYVKIGAVVEGGGGGGGSALTHVDIEAGPVALDLSHKNKVLMMHDLGLVEITLDPGIFAVDDEIYFRSLNTQAFVTLGAGCQFSPGVYDDPGTYTDQYFKLKRVTDNEGDEVWDYIPLTMRWDNRYTLVVDADYTVALVDDGCLLNAIAAGGTDFLLPAFYFEGGEIRFRQGTTDPVTLTPDTGTSLEVRGGGGAETGGLGSVIHAKFVSGVWWVWGDLA